MPALLEMNTSPAEPEQADRKAAMRFQHPSGSRPLDGYTIKRGVGRGGFGEVYFAVSDAGKEVALKLIRRNLEVELRGVTHCLNLKHPNLIDIYDIRTDEHDDRWVVMEYVSGASLEDVIARYPDGMPQDMAVHWFEGICAAVAYLHDHGIVHRDLKPANIFIDEGRVKIGDYGLSKFISCSRRSGQTESVGTVHYMAPEIANGRYGREIDSYALGIILFEMLTGHVPFEGESVGEVLMKHLTAEPDLSRLDEPFRSVVRGAMAKDPERRIDNATEMAAMLRGVPRPADAEAAINGAAASYMPSPRKRPRGDSPAGDSPDEPQPHLFPGMPPEGPPSHWRGWREFIHQDPEPVTAAVRRGWRGVLDEARYNEWTPPQRFVAKALIIIAGIALIKVWGPVVAALAVAYFSYLILRVVARVVTIPPASKIRSKDPPYAAMYESATPAPQSARTETATPASFAASSAQPAALAATLPHPAQASRRPWRRRGQATWRHAAYGELTARPWRDRISTLLASMLLAAVIAPTASLLVCLFTTSEFQGELYLWSAVVATLASWAIMIPAQLAEGRVEDQAPMRFIQLLVGALVGVMAFAVAEAMFLRLPTYDDMAPGPHDTLTAEMLGTRYDSPLTEAYRAGSVQLPLPMFAAYFAFTLAIVRWWKQGEWTRPSRVSLWTMAWSGAVAWMVALLWWFPQPVGALTAAVISFTVQLASPWLSPSRRKELAQAALV